MELSSEFLPKTISDFMAEVSAIGDSSQKLSKVEDYVGRLEEERRKIDAFKRELPLCVLLVSDAIGRLREEEKAIKSEETRAVEEEFMPLKGNSGDGGGIGTGGVKSESDFSDKRNWMSSAQLWMSSNVDSESDKQISSVSDLKPRNEEDDGEEGRCEKRIGGVGNYRSKGGAFVPFKVSAQSGSGSGSGSSSSSQSQVPSLSLMPPLPELGGGYGGSKSMNSNSKTGTCRVVSGSTFLTEQVKFPTKPQTQQKQQQTTHNHNQQQQQQQQQPFRKQRRCWSPELHRRFVDALQQLGGSQAATPKQIRELMQVEGLTNDEVKSHLQKYRLHVRKLPNSSAAQGGSGGGWMEQDHSGDNSKANLNMSQSGSPQGPLGASGSNKALSNTGCDDSTEAEEDEKSDGHSWRCVGGGGGKEYV